MANFWSLLRDELRDVTGCEYLTIGAVKRALQVSAGRATEGDLGTVTIARQVDPESGTVYHILEADEGARVLLDTQDVKTLRAILCNYDEDAPARPGDPLSAPLQLPNGLVVTVWPDGETWEV